MASLEFFAMNHFLNNIYYLGLISSLLLRILGSHDTGWARGQTLGYICLFYEIIHI